MNSISLKAYAKLNLFLDITGRRKDGYHTLKTVMHSVGLYDELTLTLSDGKGIEIASDRADLPLDENNLVYKGIVSVLAHTGYIPKCRITAELKKNIPSGAGMGGGSADCAAAIVGMNQIFDLGLDETEMRAVGKNCGADVPFCISGGAALCEGIGDIITPLDPLTDICFAIVKPEQSISTPAAYKQFDINGIPNAGNYTAFEAAYYAGAEKLGGVLYNAFSESCDLEAVSEAKLGLQNDGAYGAEMTGSGAAVFGVFDNSDKARAAAEKSGCTFRGAFAPTYRGVEITFKG